MPDNSGLPRFLIILRLSGVGSGGSIWLVKAKFSENLYGRGNVAWGQCRGKKLQSGYFLLEQDEIDDINSSSGVYCDHMQLVTSSAVLTYRPFAHTTITGQMLFGSGLRTARPGEKTNSGHSPSYTTYNLSIEQLASIMG